MKLLLLALFFVTALLYASVGFGGGSTYTALLVLVDANYLIIPIISLCCNILVVSGNSFQYIRSGYVSVAKGLAIFSPLCSHGLGGRVYPYSENLFYWFAVACFTFCRA